MKCDDSSERFMGGSGSSQIDQEPKNADDADLAMLAARNTRIDLMGLETGLEVGSPPCLVE